MSRVTVAEVERHIALVVGAAEREGITVMNYAGNATFTGLYLRRENGTAWLSSNGSDIGNARGLREVLTFLQGMYAGLDAIRHNRNAASAAHADAIISALS